MCVVLLLYVAVVACFFPSAWTWLSNNSSNLDDDDAEDDGTLFNAQRLRFALISTFWLEVIFWTAQSLLLLITRNPELFTAWTIKKKTRLLPFERTFDYCTQRNSSRSFVAPDFSLVVLSAVGLPWLF